MRQDITLDVRKRETSFGRAKLLPLRRGEKGNRELVVSIEEDGRAYDLSGKTASLVATTAAGKLVGPCPMEVAEAGIARIMLPAALYSAVGAFSGYVEIREGETLVDTTDSFGGKVIECADLDSEQAAEFTPLLGELQNAVAEEAKRIEAEKARAQAETERETGFAEAKQAAQTAAKAANDAAADANLAAGTASDAAKSANTAAGKATNAAAKAESDVRAFVNAAGTAIGDAIAGAKADVDAAVKRSDAASAKAEAATETAETANTAATQAVSDARAAIAEVKATEAKLYPAAENILKGTVNDTFVNVDDAFSSAALREITVEGACKQDGTPSPDNPVPIHVIENPVVNVAGRNLLDSKYPAYVAAYNNGFAIINKYSYDNPSAVLPLTTGPRSSDGFGFIERLKPNVTYTLKAFNEPGNSIVCITGYKRVEDINDANNAVWHLKETSLGGPVSFSVKEGGECVVFTFAAKWGDGTNKITYPAEFKATVECGSTATEYKPHTSQTLAFTLPAEHPYLAKLPDGTADEIVVDELGNVELVAKVGVDKNVREVRDFAQGHYYSLGTTIPPFKSPYDNYNAPVMCSALSSKNTSSNNEGIYRTWTGIYVRDTSGRTKEEIQAEVDKNAPLTVVAVIPETRYSLGKIEMPKAQDSIINVWTDAEVTPNTGIKYVRDVNIVVANLESAIASITEG